MLYCIITQIVSTLWVAGTEAGKALVAQGTTGAYASNAPKVLNASHVVVLCTRMLQPCSYPRQLKNNPPP